MNFFSALKADRPFLYKLTLFVLAFGIVLQVEQFLDDRSLWLDEAYISLDIAANSFSDLLKGRSIFPYQPRPAVGFLLIQKLSTLVWGNDEFSFRFIPLVSGALSLVLFVVLARKRLAPVPACVASVLFCLAPPLIHYSGEASKPYSTDVLLTVITYLFALHLFSKDCRIRDLLIFGLFGLCAPWLSYTACFVLAAATPVLLYVFWTEERKKLLAVWAACCFLWAANVMFIYAYSVTDLLNNEYLLKTWQFAFIPKDVRFYQKISWFLNNLLDVFPDVLGVSNKIFMAVLFLLGLGVLFKSDKKYAVLLVLPIIYTLILNFLNKFPFHGRMVLFLAPAFCLGAARGIVFLGDRAGRLKKTAVLALVLFILAPPLNTAFDRLAHSDKREEMRPLMEYLRQNYQAGDALYLNNAAQYAYGYYNGLLSFNRRPLFVGRLTQIIDRDYRRVGVKVSYMYHVYNKDGYLIWKRTHKPPYEGLKKRLLTFQNNERSWFVLSHFEKDFEKELVAFLDDHKGEKVLEKKYEGASLYLYDLSRSTLFKDSFFNGSTLWVN